MHIVQIANHSRRRVAVVREPELILLREVDSVFALARKALLEGCKLSNLIEQMMMAAEKLSYDTVYAGQSEWKLLAPIDCPGDPQRVHVSGTGLTHLGSALDRQAMHAATAAQESQMTDSMRMFEWGRQQGRPTEGTVGIAPEWFYKGDGSIVQAPFDPLPVPGFAEDGGEEAEVAAIYLVADDGTPWRIGMAIGNEFSDHVFERLNYLNLAGSKLRMCSLGPELAIAPKFDDVAGRVKILRRGELLWEKQIRTGDSNMCHSLANIEHHHFKFAAHRQPGTVHIHFMGADCLSFGEGIRLQTGDITEIQFEGFGRPLRNTIMKEESVTKPLRVQPME